MTNDLYFIPLLMEALERENVVEGLRRAFRTIVVRGKDKQFRKGYEQFKVFMDAVFAAHRSWDRIEERGFITGGGLDETTMLLEELAACPELAAVWDSVRQDLELKPDAEPRVEFLLRQSDGAVQRLRLSHDRRKGEMTGVVPGAYEILLASGQVLWESELTKEDLLSVYAHREEPLRLAADTGGVSEQPTRRTVLLDGEVVVTVFAGQTTGRLEIEWCW